MVPMRARSLALIGVLFLGSSMAARAQTAPASRRTPPSAAGTDPAGARLDVAGAIRGHLLELRRVLGHLRPENPDEAPAYTLEDHYTLAGPDNGTQVLDGLRAQADALRPFAEFNERYTARSGESGARIATPRGEFTDAIRSAQRAEAQFWRPFNSRERQSRNDYTLNQREGESERDFQEQSERAGALMRQLLDLHAQGDRIVARLESYGRAPAGSERASPEGPNRDSRSGAGPAPAAQQRPR